MVVGEVSWLAEMVTDPGAGILANSVADSWAGAMSSVESRNSTMLSSAEGEELSMPTNSNKIIIFLLLALSSVL